MASEFNKNEFTSYGEFMASIKEATKLDKALVDEFCSETTLLKDLPVQEASGPFDDTTPHSEPWEYNKKTHLAMLDEGARAYKDTIYTSKDSMSLRKTAIKISKDSFDAQGPDGKMWRAQQIVKRVRDLGKDKEHDYIWGNPRIDKKQSLGIMPRFNLITDIEGVIKSGEHKGEIYPYVTIDAGGTSVTGNLCSILLLHPSAVNGVGILYPNSSMTNYPGGMRYRPGNFQDVEDEFGGTLACATDIFSNMSGIAMNNRRACIRIANIDIYSPEGLKNLIHSMYEALEAVSDGANGDLIAYCPKQLRINLRQYLDDAVNPAVYSQRIQPRKGDFSIGGMNLRALDHLACNESKLV